MTKNSIARWAHECPKTKDKLHLWVRQPDLTAECFNCKMKLDQQEASDCFDDRGRC